MAIIHLKTITEKCFGYRCIRVWRVVVVLAIYVLVLFGLLMFAVCKIVCVCVCEVGYIAMSISES